MPPPPHPYDHRMPFRTHGPLLLTLGAIALSSLLLFGPVHLVEGAHWVAPLTLTVALARWVWALRMPNRLPKPIRPLRLTLVLLALGGLVATAVAAFAAQMEQVASVTPCGERVTCRVYARGAFGGTWMDVVARETFLAVLYRERPLAQFERESVLTTRFLPERGQLELTVAAYQQPARTVVLDLPAP